MENSVLFGQEVVLVTGAQQGIGAACAKTSMVVSFSGRKTLSLDADHSSSGSPPSRFTISSTCSKTSSNTALSPLRITKLVP